MSPPLKTPFGHAAPQALGHENEHAITTHFSTWNHVLRFIERDPEIMQGFRNMYPRVMMQKQVVELSRAVVQAAGVQDQSCLLFMAPDSANECIQYATDPRRGDTKLEAQDMSIRVFEVGKQRLWAAFFPIAKTPNMVLFWVVPGVGVSTRLAEGALKHISEIREVTSDGCMSPPSSISSSAHDKLRVRISKLINRSPRDPGRKQPSKNDVYLFQTGMSAIYRIHQFLLKTFNLPTVLFGFPFHATHHLFDDFGPSMKFYGLGNKEDTDDLDSWLNNNKIQALFTEMPSNPLAVTPDLHRLRALADKHHFIIILDDTVGSFCNVDVSSVADIVMTSLTKSFSGYADVMGGSLVVNPSLPRYEELKSIVDKHYRNDLHPADAEVLLSNAQDYLSRSTILNRNALALASYFQKKADDPKSCLTKVYHPSTLPSRTLYEAFMRPPTAEFKPSYGALLSIDFAALECTAAFYDALNTHKAPHLGAHVTLSLPYVKGLFNDQLEWAGQYDLRETMIRLAPGLEEEVDLLEDFEAAMAAAEKAWRGSNGVRNDEKVMKPEDLAQTIS